MEFFEKRISVLMACYKEPVEYLKTAIDSIINQTFSDFEYIIILDAPENIVLKQILYEYELKDKRIKVYINEKNLGLPLTLNRGLTYCKGKYIARMDADDIAESYRLEKELNFIEANNYDIIGSWFESFNEKGKLGFIMNPVTDNKCKAFLRRANCIGHPTWFVKKEVYNTLKGYRNIFACEDYDFILRAALFGFKIGNVPEKLLNYRINSNSISETNFCIQSLCAKYLAENYKKRNSPSEEKILEYVNSDKGKKK